MPVFRVEKNSNYTTMCNYHLRDQGLSLKGKGLLSMLLSLPDTWNYSVRGLSSITPDGVDGVLTALKELERLGYLERNQQRESMQDIYAGDFLVVGLTEDDFGSLTSEQMQKFEEQFHQPQMFVRMGRSIMAIPVPDDMVKKMEEKAAKPQEKSKPAPDRDSL